MTLYILNGFAQALEFGVEVPQGHGRAGLEIRGQPTSGATSTRAWRTRGRCEFVTFLNYVLSSYPDEGWYGGAFDAA